MFHNVHYNFMAMIGFKGVFVQHLPSGPELLWLDPINTSELNTTVVQLSGKG